MPKGALTSSMGERNTATYAAMSHAPWLSMPNAPEGALAKAQPKISGVKARWADTTAVHGLQRYRPPS